MQKLATFWTSLTRSASEPEYYEHILRSKFSFSLKFFLLAQILVTLLTILVFSVRRVPVLTVQTEAQIKQVVGTLPDTFHATYTQGHLTFQGISLPYTVKTPGNLVDVGFPATLATLGNKPSASSPLTFTSDQVIVGNNTKNTLSYRDLWDDQAWSVNRDRLARAAITLSNQVASHSLTVLLFLSPVLYLLLTANAIVMVLFFSVMTQLIAWILRLRLPYKKAVQMGLHAIIVSLAVDKVRLALWPSSPFEITGPAFFGIMLLALISLKRRYTLTLK
jgi:hypothetical protein